MNAARTTVPGVLAATFIVSGLSAPTAVAQPAQGPPAPTPDGPAIHVMPIDKGGTPVRLDESDPRKAQYRLATQAADRAAAEVPRLDPSPELDRRPIPHPLLWILVVIASVLLVATAWRVHARRRTAARGLDVTGHRS